MQRACEQLGLPTVDTVEGKKLLLQAECVFWKPRKFFGNVGSADFSSVMGKWENHKISLEIIEHPTALTSSSSEDDDDELSELEDSFSDFPIRPNVGINRRRTKAPVRRTVPKRRERRDDSKYVLQGKLHMALMPDASNAGLVSSSPAPRLQWAEVSIEAMNTVVRYDVPQDRSIPFLLSPEELRQIKEDVDSADSKSNELPSMPSLTNASTPQALPQPESPSGLRHAVTTNIAMSIKNTVSKITSTSRIVYTCGSIGLKWLDLSGSWSFIAFRTTDECVRWVTLLRRVIVSQLFFQTFQEVFTLKLRFDDKLLLEKPDISVLAEQFLAHEQKKATKLKDPRVPPGKGVLTFRSGERVNQWVVCMDSNAEPHSTNPRHTQIMHCFKVGKTILDKPRNALVSLNVAKALTSSEDINLRRTSIHVPMPFSNQFFLQQQGRRGIVRRIEAHAESMENRIAWEEWLQSFGAVKILSEEELAAQNNIIGGLEDWGALVEDAEDDASTNEVRPRARSLGRLGSSARSPSPFQWLAAKQVTTPRRSPSSESLRSPNVTSPHQRTSTRISSASSIGSPTVGRQESNGSRDFADLPPLPRNLRPGSNLQYNLPAVLMVTSRQDSTASQGNQDADSINNSSSAPSEPVAGHGQQAPFDSPCADDPLAKQFSSGSSIDDIHTDGAPPLALDEAPPSIGEQPLSQEVADTHHISPSQQQLPLPEEIVQQVIAPVMQRDASSSNDAPEGQAETPASPQHAALTAPQSKEDMTALETSIKDGASPGTPKAHADKKYLPDRPVQLSPRHAELLETSDLPASPAIRATFDWVLRQGNTTPTTSAAGAHHSHDTEPQSLGSASMHFSSMLGGLGKLPRTISSVSEGDCEQAFGPFTKSYSVFDGADGFGGATSLDSQKQKFRNSLQSFRREHRREDTSMEDLERFSNATSPTRLRQRHGGHHHHHGGLSSPPEAELPAVGPPVDAESRSSSLNSEDADLAALNPILSSARRRNALEKQKRICPLCHCDKATVLTCSATGRNHVRSSSLATTTTSPLRLRLSLSPVRVASSVARERSYQKSPSRSSRFIRHTDESHEVLAARIFLELE